MLKLASAFVLTAAVLLAAPSAHAQKADEFRLIGSSDDATVMAGTLVKGPKNDRRTTEVLVRRERSNTGADAYVIEAIANCDAGTLAIGDVKVYQGTSIISEIPRGEENVSTPEAGSVAEQVFNYLCTGAVDFDDKTRVTGVLSAITYGRKALGLD